MEQAGLEPVHIWDAGSTGGGFTSYATAPTLLFSLKSIKSWFCGEEFKETVQCDKALVIYQDE